MWNDQRSAPIAKRLDAEYGEEIFQISMQHPTATWTMPQLAWLREHEPENILEIHRIFFTKDYVRHTVTGDWCTDHVDAQGSLLYDAREGCWSKSLCDMIGLDLATLPPVRRSKEIVGAVNDETARRTGLCAGTPVITGCSDTAAEDYGSGAVEDGQLLVKLATAGNVYVIFNHSHPHPKSYTYPFAVEGMWYTVTGTCASASSYRWLRDALYAKEKQECEQKGDDVYLIMDADATQLCLIGGGAKSPLWFQIIADVFGLPVVRPQIDDSSFGGALLAGVGVGVFKDEISAVRQCNKIKSRYEPNMENHALYQKIFPLYQQFVAANMHIWDQLSEIANQ